MKYFLDLSKFSNKETYELGDDFSGVNPGGSRLAFNNFYMTRDGKPFFAVSGEFHYSRMDPVRWENEIIKMRMAGINIISTYVFWNHIEQTEGKFDFTGRNDLQRFVKLCHKHDMYVILRIGPFDHGEVRNGGLPDWLYGKPFEVRHTGQGFMDCVRKLYGQISSQVHGLFYENGGPVIGVQLDNEYMHSSAGWEMTTGISNEWIPRGDEGEKYILELRNIALECGLKPVFFTGTAWGGAAYCDKVMPLWGGYAYRPWIFYSHKGEHPATEEYIYEDYHRNGAVCVDDFTPAYEPETRPYACCEMGAGMMCSYYYRFIFPYKSVDALANVKIGSGCNFIGYYMFQGGTNPVDCNGKYMNEAQVSKISYDYQAALGEFGQIRESYSRLKPIHYFAKSFGEVLAPMETVLFRENQIDSAKNATDTETLRLAVRTDGRSGFLFVNNFQDHLALSRKENENVEISTGAENIDFNISIDTDENAILPFNFQMDGILLKSATAQPVLRTVIEGRITYVFMVPDGMEGKLEFAPGTSLVEKNCEKYKLLTAANDEAEVDVLLIDRKLAGEMFILRDGSIIFTSGALLEDENGNLRLESTNAAEKLMCCPADRLAGTGRLKRIDNSGIFGQYEACTEAADCSWLELEVEHTAPYRWVIRMKENPFRNVSDLRLQIDYEGDIGSLFYHGNMISDNFANGDTWEIGLLEHKAEICAEKMPEMVLGISPIREGASVNVASSMAARNEIVRRNIAELKGIRLQPVYEIQL